MVATVGRLVNGIFDRKQIVMGVFHKYGTNRKKKRNIKQKEREDRLIDFYFLVAAKFVGTPSLATTKD